MWESHLWDPPLISGAGSSVPFGGLAMAFSIQAYGSYRNSRAGARSYAGAPSSVIILVLHHHLV